MTTTGISSDSEFMVRPIGIVHSPYQTRQEAPRQGGKTTCRIEIFSQYADGLRDVETFSHLHVIYWLHESEGYDFAVHTPWDTRPHGLFATRTPNRPNPLGYAAVELVDRRENVLTVEGLDAIDGTPVLDIKPYIPSVDAKPEAKIGWLEGKMKK